MHWFFASHIDRDKALLSEEESHHATKVLRLTPGTAVIVMDGDGRGWQAQIGERAGKNVVCLLGTPLPQQPKPNLTLAIAPTKNIDRTEWLVEKATEIGIAKIVFFLSKNSERKKIRMDRIAKVALAATKQSQRLYLPELVGLIVFRDVLQAEDCDVRCIAWCGTEERPAVHLQKAIEGSKKPCILIGPEGDFTPEEVAAAESAGFTPVSLGEARLRTETAGIYSCVVNQMTT